MTLFGDFSAASLILFAGDLSPFFAVSLVQRHAVAGHFKNCVLFRTESLRLQISLASVRQQKF